jgi:acetyltransferase
VLDAARPHLLRLIGPNCVGLIVPGIGLDASFSHLAPPEGDIAFVSQSGTTSARHDASQDPFWLTGD